MIWEALNNWKILKKILYTLGFIFLFRIGVMITIPGASLENTFTQNNGSFLSILNMLGGGGISTFSLFALGATPYITASIVIQLLSSDVIPYLTKLKKQGEKGRIKMEKITRLVAVFIAIIQALSITTAMLSSGFITIDPGISGFEFVVFVVIVMVAGSMVTMWIADQITMKGIGNGTSLIIFSGIVAQIPYKISTAFHLMVDPTSNSYLFGFMIFFIYSLIALITIFILGFIETSERRIPIQQTGQGLNLIGDKQTYLPLKINPAGVVPVIFASAIMTLPPTIAQFLPASNQKDWIIQNFALTSWLGLVLYSILIVAFSFFYAQININPEETADNFKKSSTFIIGVKPGEDTRRYLSGVINSITFYGSIALMLIAITPYLLTHLGIPQTIAFGGTGMIIMISVAVETWDQLKSRVVSERTKKQIKDTDNNKKNMGWKVNEEKQEKKKGNDFLF